MSIENKQIVLQLNANWLPTGYCSIKKALISMNSSEDGHSIAAKAIDIEFAFNAETGEWDFDNPAYMNPVSWDEWVKLPVREYDLAIHTAKMAIRVPTVILAINHNKIHTRKVACNSHSIRERDNNTCQYTGRRLSKDEGNVDHVISRDEWRKRGLKGSPDCFENMVYCDKQINFAKGNKSLAEAGLKLIRQPRAPLPVPASALIKEARHFSWKPFLINK